MDRQLPNTDNDKAFTADNEELQLGFTEKDLSKHTSNHIQQTTNFLPIPQHILMGEVLNGLPHPIDDIEGREKETEKEKELRIAEEQKRAADLWLAESEMLFESIMNGNVLADCTFHRDESYDGDSEMEEFYIECTRSAMNENQRRNDDLAPLENETSQDRIQENMMEPKSE